MGESKRTQGAKVGAVIERLNAVNQQLYLAVAELAVYRVMAGPMDTVLYRTVMAKLANKEFTNIEAFFNDVTQAAKDRMVELDIAAEQQEKAATLPEGSGITSFEPNSLDQLLSQIGSEYKSTPSEEG